MTPYRIYANYRIGADNGMVAIGRGPLIYCAEGADNKDDIYSLAVARFGEIKVGDFDSQKLYGIVPMTVPGSTKEDTEALYMTLRPERTETEINLIPYYAWGNRGLNKMRIWLPEE